MTEERKARPAKRMKWDEEDVRNLYRFVLRREPESEATVKDQLNRGRDELVRGFFSSVEFLSSIDEALARGDRPWSHDDHFLSGDLRDWVARRFALSDGARSALLAAPSSLTRQYWALLGDAQFQAQIGAETPVWRSRLEALGKLAAIEGRIEAIDGRVVRGWVHGFDRAEPLIVEVWAGGALCFRRNR